VVSLEHLHLLDFRAYGEATFSPDVEGTTVISGPNGTGKTTLLEAVGYLGTQRSFRGATREVMVRNGCDRAFVRAELQRDGLPLLVEAELSVQGRSRAQVNRQPTNSRRDLATAVPVTVFSPEDLGVVQGGPARRRELLDDALSLLDPRAASLADEAERILRQRGALLRQSGGRLSPEIETSLDVWDERLAEAGDALAEARRELALRLQPSVTESYEALAQTTGAPVTLVYRQSWEGPLSSALVASRRDDLRRGSSTVGPHRDDLLVTLAGRDTRTQGSQGEQRCVALALRLAIHRLVGEHNGALPILLLDDVFSELDPARSKALLTQLPKGQTLLTTAVPLPDGVEVSAVVDATELGIRPQ
jgi:DNA replication and repair protein RecF